MKNQNNCVMEIKNFNIEFDYKSSHPSNEQLIDAINKELKRVVRTKEWKKYDSYYFGFDYGLIKKVNSITYVSGVENINCYESNGYSGNIVIKLDFVLIDKI